MIISIIGPSGSGKDTQANLLVQKLGIPNISTGQILREEILSESKLGNEVEAVIAEGRWLSDDLIYKLLVSRLEREDAKNGFIINGFPRTEGQIALFDKIVETHHQDLRAVIHFKLPDEEVMRRMHKQIQESDKRPDITEAAMQQRLISYKNTIDPILDEYRKRGILLDVDGSPSIEEVHKVIMEGLRIEN